MNAAGSKGDARAYALLALVMLFWAGNSIVGRAVRDDVGPFTLAFVRWFFALLLLLPFTLRTVVRERAAIMKGWAPILLLGLMGVGAFNALLYSGLRETTATNALLIQAGIPALVMLLNAVIFRERAPRTQQFGVLISTLGVLIIIFQGDAARALSLHFGGGDLLILLAVVAWAFYTVLLRLRPEISAGSFVTVTFAIGALAMAPLAWGEWRGGALPILSPGVIAAFAYVAILPSTAAYFIFNMAVSRVGAANAGQAITLMPLFGALLSALLLGEMLHSYHGIGMALILAGILISAFVGRCHRPQDSAGTGNAAPLERVA